MEAIRFVTHQAQVLQVHRNSAKFAFNFVKPENLKETLYPQELRSSTTTSSTKSIAMTKISYQRPTASSVVMATGYASMATSPGPSLDGRGSFFPIITRHEMKVHKIVTHPFPRQKRSRPPVILLL